MQKSLKSSVYLTNQRQRAELNKWKTFLPPNSHSAQKTSIQHFKLIPVKQAGLYKSEVWSTRIHSERGVQTADSRV